MRVIELHAEAFKRLKAVTIRPTSNVVEITGDNSEGKTSTLDAIWAALGGKDACPDKPIHTGEKEGKVTLVLGDAEPKLVVTRRFRLKEGVPYTTDLTVESAEGARFPSAQGVLDQLVGSLCFDPMSFLGLPDKDQIAALRGFVEGVDFAHIEGLNRRDFEQRTEVGRRIRDLKGQLAAMPTFAGDPPERVDTDALEGQLAEAGSHNALVGQAQARRDGARARLARIAEELAALHAEQARLEEAAKADVPAPIDTTKVREQLEEGRHANATKAVFEQRQAVEAKVKAAEDEDTALTAAITQRKDEMAKAVQAAKMPIKGLGFADDAVTLNGEPLAQASRAEQIRVSVAIAAAMNPKLRVARVMDGSLLDRKSWAALEAYATEHDLQVWVETVTAHGKAAVVIEDGGVVSPGAKAPAVEPVGDVL